MKRSNQQQDPHFKNFIHTLEGVIAGHGKNSTERQRSQVEGLVKLEHEFRRALIQHRWGKFVYQDFIRYIMEERRNILAARPFFRERDQTFTGYFEKDDAEDKRYIRGIADVLRDAWDVKAQKPVAWRGLYRFNFNYQFVNFVINSRRWRAGSEVVRLAKAIEAMRHEIVEMNMPMAISQAKMFSASTPKSHLEYMDFIQIAGEGLLSAIDKFVPPYKTVFRTVATHRMRGNFIKTYSETLLHFYPKDKRRLYRAHKFLKDQREAETPNLNNMLKEVNRDIRKTEHASEADITNLLSAASVVSANSIPVDMDEGGDGPPASPIDKYAAPPSSRPDIAYEDAQLHDSLDHAVGGLSTMERKLLRMKGVDL